MHRLLSHKATLLLLCVLFATLSHAQELLIQRTGVSLPSNVLGFARGEETDFEATIPFGGTAVKFELPGKATATLYAYKLNVSPLPQSIKDASASSERDQVVQGVLNVARGQDQNAPSANSRKLMSAFIKTKNNPETPVSLDSFVVYPGGRATNNVLFMWVARSHIWKLRLTHVPGEQSDAPIPFAFFLVDATLAK